MSDLVRIHIVGFLMARLIIHGRTKKDVQRPKPRHSLPGSATTDDLDMFNSTTTIRQAIYNEWRNEKMKTAKQQLAEQKKKEEEERKKERKGCYFSVSMETNLSLMP